jgi:hypothetical protein
LIRHSARLHSRGLEGVFANWMADLSTYWNNNNGMQALWGMITGAFSGLLESLLLLIGYILFPIAYALFSLFYTLYGSILYVVGPFVLALYPAFGFRRARRSAPSQLRGGS